MNFYLNVLVESFLVSAPIPFASNPTFFAMLGFGSYNMPMAVAMASIGSALGAIASFLVGYFLMKLYRQKGGEKHLSREKYNVGRYYFSRYFIYLLPFSWLPLLNFLALIAGFLSIKPRLVLSLAIVGYIAHYSYYLFM